MTLTLPPPSPSLRQYGLDKDFKLNIEANHATLAGHSFQHDLRVAAINDMLGSVDANQGDMLLGWDTDQFPSDVYETTLAMYEILKSGGLKGAGSTSMPRTAAPPTRRRTWWRDSSWAWTPLPWA